ncbi:lytic transglycosylase domain-containing protein [Paraburkholderia sp. J12]|uniref:lytic transglycosylase domain-containing protein n=1 Tax=Paraburkholderia sp. J12 TaxID=2805432 RepID=UPI002ABDDD85|nr:lytic transglycosylase domain-containing protein [Paraburkholderia sp. J12]
MIYIVGGRGQTVSGVRAATMRSAVPASLQQVTAQDRPQARGVVLSGARLTTAFQPFPLPSAPACADCDYATVAPIIRAVSHITNVDPALVAAVIDVESGFNRNALSSAGARGLMQLMPATAMRFGVSNANDPVQNVAAGSLYLSQLLQQFSGNLPYALAAYNAGESSVRSYGGIPPFAETEAYVPRVLARYAAFRTLFGPRNDTGPAARPTLHMTLTGYRQTIDAP